MYIPKQFEETRSVRLHEFIGANPLATLVIAGDAGLTANHVPLLLRSEPGPDGCLAGHVARSNPLWQQAAQGVPCLAIFHGLQHYISPNGYATRAQTRRVVPTWNYEVVHVRGSLRTVADAAWMRELVAETTTRHEAGQPAPWTMDEAPADYLDGMMNGIVGIQIDIATMIGKFKLSQNQPAANQRSLIATLRASGSSSALEMAQAIERRCSE